MQQTRKVIDLNSDVGESFGNYTIGLDEEVVPLISSANIACGYHAGDPAVMRRTVRLALASEVGPGAHPGLPDLMGFGRRAMDVTLDEIRDYVTYQVGALMAFTTAAGGKLQHVKPHGALYHSTATHPAAARALVEAAAELAGQTDSAVAPDGEALSGALVAGCAARRAGAVDDRVAIGVEIWKIQMRWLPRA